MNREIKFRAKGIEENDKNRWYYGSYYKTDDTTYCFEEDYIAHPDNTKHYILFDETTDWCLPNRKLRADIDINTLGQFTGFKDKNGVEIYEGDIIRKFAQKGYGKRIKEVELILQVVYEVSVAKSPNGKELNRHSEFTTKQLNRQEWTRASWSMFCNCEVIGNIYENPELLKESEE